MMTRRRHKLTSLLYGTVLPATTRTRRFHNLFKAPRISSCDMAARQRCTTLPQLLTQDALNALNHHLSTAPRRSYNYMTLLPLLGECLEYSLCAVRLRPSSLLRTGLVVAVKAGILGIMYYCTMYWLQCSYEEIKGPNSLLTNFVQLSVILS